MNLTDLLENLSAKNVELWVDGDKLRYRAPENVLTPELLVEIKQYKEEIIYLLQKRTDTAKTDPLSYRQKALWFLYELAPNSAAYNLAYAARLVSNVDIPALRQAAIALIERHPVLRTTYTVQHGEPVQTIQENQEVCFSVQEAANWSQDDFHNWLVSESDRPFDLNNGPVLRFNLLIKNTLTDASAGKEVILLMTAHHIVVDFWSLELLVSELRVFYEAIKTGQQVALPPQNLQYFDYVRWENQMLASQQGERLWNYWRDQLAGELPILNLPTDRPRPPVQTYEGASYSFVLEEKLTDKLLELVKAEGVTLYTIVLAAFQVLLLRYTNQEDILIGTPMAGRSLTDFERIVGYFANPVVCRADLSGNPTFRELLCRVRSCVLGALEHQDYPFPVLVERLQPLRDPSRSPLYQVAFVWDRSRQSEGQLSLMDSDGLIVESITPESKGAAFDLTLTIFDVTGPLKGIWKYNTDLFDSSTIERMAGHFQTLLCGIVANPIESISQLPLLTEPEQQQLLVEWNDTTVEYPTDKCIHQLFEEQAQRTPDAVAVVYVDALCAASRRVNQQLTYYELNCRANQLAHQLRSLGVGPEVLVGLCVERSLLMVVGLLGILKAGGAYVPLDPEYPTQRLSFMLEDATVGILLTQQHLVERLPQHQAQAFCLDEVCEQIAQNYHHNPISGVRAFNLANVIYTSGSTGRPKGVMVTHTGLCNLAQAQIQTFGVQNSSRILQFASLSFDASISEIVMALASGARLYLGTKDSLLPGMPLIQRLRDDCITHITLPPSALCVLPVEELPALQTMIVAGEACSAEVIRLWSAGRNFFNAYGPTEASVCATVAKCTDGDNKAFIGRPIANTQIYILDSHLQPVPIGVPGELHIAGAGLARGYLNRPELTTEKFIPNPFENSKFKIQNSKWNRLYKTGDLARYLPDGNIEYLGRIDNQVKIRGFRIELGEIEAVLSQHPSVHSVVVTARVDTPGDQRLVAYIVPQLPTAPTISELRQFLKVKLPEYMVPSAIVILEALPVTPNGKVDRRALPAPELHRELLDKYVAPRTPIEEMLTHIWAGVLRVKQVGIHDNFFELGGHSLLATQLISRIRTCLKVELPLRSVFAAVTVAQLAREIQQWQQQQLELTVPPLLPTPRNADLPLSFAQQRLWFLDQLKPNSAFYNIPGAVRLQGQLQVTALEQSLREIIHRHEALRTNFITVDGQPVQIIHSETAWTLSIVDWQHLPITEQEIATQQLASSLAQQPFDLASEPLFRTTLVVLKQTEYILLVCMHHIISDGWSMGVFVQELAALYNAYSQGQPGLRDATLTPLAPLKVQYADFAVWQRQWLQGEVLQTQLAYWQQQLANAPALLSLPTDRPRGAEQTFAGAHLTFALSSKLTLALTQLSQQQGVTLFMTLLAAFDILLYRYTGTEDILVGSPIANRNLRELEGLIGFFVNTLVLRTDVSGNPSFSELLGRVRDMAIDAYAHQDLPFEMLVEALQPQRDLSHTPLFQVMFVLQNAPMPQLNLTGLSVSPLVAESATAKFDLTLSMENTATGLVGVWEYNTDLFDATTIKRMAGHFQTLLEGIVSNPQQPISQLPLLSEVERQQLLVEWNSTTVEYPTDKCIHQLFEEQVERTPHAVAVVYENQQLTYDELNCRANQLAHYLRSLGVRADVLVGIYVERSLEMVVGLLAILKAGGAYVPLDPEYPTQRLSFMLEDAQVGVLVTQQHLVERLPQHQAQLVCLDTEWSLISQLSQNNPITGVQASHLAYVIYTSGSTGAPKGVLVAHQGLLNLVFWHKRAFEITRLDKATQLAGTAFDATVWELWPYLTVGASIYLVKYELLGSPVELRDWLISQKVTISFLPTPLAQELLSLEWTQSLAMRYILTGGDKLHQYPSDLLPLLVVNNYGPTENTVVTTSGLVVANGREHISPPIGRPIANTQVYILDSHLQPVPIGVPGELYIGGAGLARGYLNRPQLTTEKFIPNPFSTDPNSRLYKTGDLARYLPDGNIEYLGRIDNQVKIRGFRIELGEIEAVLSQHPSVHSVVVTAGVDTPGGQRLVAYIVPQQHKAPTISELRQFLKAKLPEYMVPQAIVILESLPLTPNGKVDRRALPAPELNRELLDKYVAPRTRIEEMLAHIWAGVLRVKQVGIHDNFFELGGDSILSIQIIARANQIGIVLSPKQLFMHQTISELAAVASTTGAIVAEQGLVTGAAPLTPIQHWFFQQNIPQPHHFNQSFLLSVPPEWKPELLEQVVQYLLLHHDALRLRFVLSESDWQQIHVKSADNAAFLWVDLSTLSAGEQTTAIETTAAQLQASLNLSKDLVRVAFLTLGVDKPSRLLIVIHHLVVDGVSWRILLEDLQTAYQQISQGKVLALPPKTTSFKDWAYRLAEYALGVALKSELAYWLSESRSSVSSIPVDYAQGINTVASASTVRVSLNSAETTALLQDVPKAYNTQINDVLLTALVLLLGRWTNSNSVLLNLEGHGREDIVENVDLSRTVGWFTTIFPVLIELKVTDNPKDALKLVKEQLRAIPNKGIGYGLLRYLSRDAEISTKLQTLPQPQISFNYLGQFDQVLNTSSGIQLATESAGANQSLHGSRTHMLDITGMIIGNQLQINWTYSTNIHKHATIESIAQEFVLTLRELIVHCLAHESGGYTPSDFPLVKLSQLELDQVLVSLAFKQELGKTNWKNIEDIYPLSPMQQGMLFHSLYAPESGVYFEQLSCTLRGNLEVQAFEQAWQQVVARHSVLRTVFVWEHLSEPLQVVYHQVKVTVETLDWRELSVEQQQQQLEIFLHSQRQQGFQLSVAPLMRLNLIQLDKDCYQFVWSFHHILLDGWSVPLIFKDLLYFYQAFSQGESLRYEPTASYRNYIAWLQKQDLALAEKFWRQKLQGFIAPTPLTVDKPLSNREQSHSSYSEQQIQLSVQATADVQSFARQHQLSVNNLVQATWALLLCRYSGETDVVFGATVSGRPPSLVGIESIVGLFINTLPVRVQVSRETQLLPLLKDLQALAFECEQYSYSPLVEIQGWSEVPRGTSLFESIVVFENYPVDAAVQPRNGSLEISSIRGIEQTNYPITVVAAVFGEQLSVKISYDTNRFDDATIIRMLGHFQTLLCGIVANPIGPVSQLPLLTEPEQQQLLVEWNDTTVEYPTDKCIHQLFEEQAQRTPDAVAIVYVDALCAASRRVNQQLTYYELNCRANQLAHQLRSLGVGPEVLVGLCVERSLLMVVGLLGILKAGGAYVPLDPEYPTQRLSFMLEDATVGILLTQQHLVERLPQHQAQAFCLDEVCEQIAQNYHHNPISGVRAFNLANVIYTSGSTGRPKGVMVTHTGLCNLAQAQIQTFGVQNSSRILQFASLSFDASISEIVMALASGARLYLGTKDSLLPGMPLIQRLRDDCITHITLPPSALCVLPVEELPALQTMIVAGEACSAEVIRLWSTNRNFFNAYGPTEASVCATVAKCTDGDNKASIGRPIANTQIYILDSNLQPVPIGVPGELHIGGVGLARGYLNRPQLTQEKFIPNPFYNSKFKIQNSKLYKTGDLARYLPDGNIEYLGRIDNQVKIRGFRIELGEIEAVLSEHPSVHSVVVTARVDTPGEQRLVAYIVPQQHKAPTISELRQFLKVKLPEYMLPSAIVMLESLPLTPNGKVDRRALPAPDTNNLSVQASFVPPLDIVEQKLAQIWAEVLKVYPVGVKDNFFELGGHSLLAVQLMAQIEQQFKQNLPLATLFQNSTIEQLATILRQPIDALNWSPLVPIQPNGSKRPFFCVPGAGGNTIYLYNLAHHLGKEQPFYGLQSLGLDGESKPHTRIEDMAAYYIEAIQSIQPSGPYLLGGHSFGGMVAFEMATQLHKRGYEVALLALLDSVAPGYRTNELNFNHLDDAGWLNMIASLFEKVYAKSLNVSEEALKVLDPMEQLNYFKQQLQMVNLLPPNVGIKQLRGGVQVFKTNHQTASVYMPQAISPAVITFFNASEIDAVSHANSEILEELGFGWDKFSAQPLDIHLVSGDHITMLNEPHVQVLAKKLTICIERSQGR
ncbi:non-ribosomal peptide synthetase [Brasilonema sp. UFV-L1]|uniref:non-ribosomal peptide synthetase n=1 Tax=Brasilonema sp. UFV-L1 TaxID=2234130 RepID=UPI00145DE625|nr:non-ribosomal peptide synthetase [Brasilonema sp. UFV-L1]